MQDIRNNRGDFTNKGIVLPTNALAFKKVFSSESNKHILKGFIFDVFGIIVEEITIQNPYSIGNLNRIKEEAGLFETAVDLLATASDHSRYTIEIQMYYQKYYPERSIYYISDKYSANYGNKAIQRNGSKYSALYPAYSLNIVNYEAFPDDQAIHIFSLYDVKNKRKFTEPSLLIPTRINFYRPIRDGWVG